MQRRDWLTALFAGLAPQTLLAAPTRAPALSFEDVKPPGDGKFARQARLIFEPNSLPQRLLILLHGRGEADSVTLALQAWSHLYGLLDAYARLQTPPITALLKEPRWESERAAQLNADLATRPFGGFAVVCPVTPNPSAFGNRNALYRAYTEWLVSDLVEAVRKRVPTIGDRVGLDGCSMGGALGFEVFLQRPEFFRSFGTVQAAIGNDRADALAERLASTKRTHAMPPIHLLTSSGDPYRQANERLEQRLRAKGVDTTLEVLHGPHNQPWLRQMGTLAMLYWHDRAL